MQNRPGSIDRVPLNTFAIALGLTGVASTWSAATIVATIPPQITQVFWVASAAATLWLITAHAVRGRRSGKPLRRQLRDPVQGPFAVIAPLVGMLIGTDALRWLRWLPTVGATIVIVSMIATAAYAGWLVSTWMTGRIELGAVHGGYILPTVAGGFLTATAADALGLHALGWAAFGVGCLFWVVMTTLLIARMISRPALPDALVPTLAVTMAPPAVGGLALFALTDHAASPLSFAFAGITGILAIAQLAAIPRYRRIRFSLGFWSFTFPVAAVATYAIAWLDVAHTPSGGTLAILLGLGVTLFVTAIGIRSLLAVAGAGAGTREEAVLLRADEEAGHPRTGPTAAAP